MATVVDVAALDAKTRGLAERGAKEAFGVSLARLLDDLKVAGEDFDNDDLNTLVLAGTLAEKADSLNPPA